MAEAVPNTNFAATAFNPAWRKEGLKEKNEALPDSSNASSQLEHGSDAAFELEPHGDAANKKAPSGDQSGQVRRITGIKWVLVVLSILSSTFLYALDNTVVADVEPKIVDRLGQIQKLPWLPIGFLVACLSTNLLWYVGVYTLASDSH